MSAARDLVTLSAYIVRRARGRGRDMRRRVILLASGEYIKTSTRKGRK